MSNQNQNQDLKHPERDQLVSFGLGRLAPDESSWIEEHLDDCDICNDTLVDIADDTFAGLVRSLPQPEGKLSDGVAGLHETVVVEPSGTVKENDLPIELQDHSRYRIVDLIGRGGMGSVYRAEHKLMNRLVALKLINAQLVKHPDAVERFRREVQAAAQLKHPNIVTAYDADQAGDAHFLVMEFVEGTDLASVVDNRGPLPIEEACRCIRRAADGLQHAHDKGMVHRDIKPHNLMLDPDGQVRILDFGLAGFATEALAGADGAGAESVEETAQHLTAIGSVMGTPDYIAPEQARDAHSADIRADIYSLGCTLYFLLAGRPPFEKGTVMEKLKSHAESEAERVDSVRVDVPAELADVISRMMPKDPAARFQTPSEVADALAPFVEKQRSGKTVSTEMRLRHPWRSAGVALLVLLIAAFGVVLYVATNKGTLVIEANDESVEVVIRKNGEEIQIIDTATGSKTVRLPSGHYEVELKGDQNEFTLDSREFVLTRGSRQIVTVRRTRQDPAFDAPPKDPTIPELPTPEFAIVNSVGMRLLEIAYGEFTMGSPESEKDRDRQERQHRVKITRPFYIGMSEVTQHEYYRVMDSNPSTFSAAAKYKGVKQRPDTRTFPVENVSWEDAMEFCRRLSASKAERLAGRVYRLPTEAEWEWACRGGTKTAFYHGDQLVGTKSNINSDPNGVLRRPTHVGSYRPNASGLYDMHGNVREWCADWYEPDYYGDSPASDPAGPSSSSVYGGSRVIRGGSWQLTAKLARSANRQYGKPTARAADLGFRVVCELRRGYEQAIAAIKAAGGDVGGSANSVTKVSFFGSRSEKAAELTDDQLVFLKGMDQLQTLYLVQTKVTDVGLEKHVKHLTELRNLYLPGTNVSDEGLGHLKELAKLYILYIDSPNVTDAGMEHLKGMINLSVLSLNDSQVTATGLKHLKRMPNLSELRLNRTKVSDADLEHLEELTSLYRLYLDGTKITDVGLKSLRKLTNLKMLYLDNTEITDAGLQDLKSLSHLRRLGLTGTKVTDEGVKKLQAALPTCQIAH